MLLLYRVQETLSWATGRKFCPLSEAARCMPNCSPLNSSSYEPNIFSSFFMPWKDFRPFHWLQENVPKFFWLPSNRVLSLTQDHLLRRYLTIAWIYNTAWIYRSTGLREKKTGWIGSVCPLKRDWWTEKDFIALNVPTAYVLVQETGHIVGAH